MDLVSQPERQWVSRHHDWHQLKEINMLELQRMVIMTTGRLNDLNMCPKRDCEALVVLCPAGEKPIVTFVESFDRVIEMMRELRPVKVELEHSHGEYCPELQQGVAAYITECTLKDCAATAQ